MAESKFVIVFPWRPALITVRQSIVLRRDNFPSTVPLRIKGEGKECINLRSGYVEGTLEAPMELVIGWRK